MITEAQALDALRLDEDATDTGLVAHYIETLPAYIEVTAGVPAEEVRESDDKLLETLELYLLQLLYCPDGTDSDRLRKVTESLEKCVAARHVYEQEKSYVKA